MSNYFFDLIAQTGDNVGSEGSLSELSNTPSINDSGLVAFTGNFGNIEDLLVGDGSEISNLSSGFSGNSRFLSGVEIKLLFSIS